MAASLLYNAGILVLFLTAFAAFYKKGRSGVVFGLAFLSMAGGLLVKAAFLFLANEGANIIKDLLFYIDKVDIVLLIDYLFKISLWFIVPLIGSLLCLISAICCFGKKARACRTNTVLWALHTLVYLFFKLGYYILAICSWFNPSEGFIMSSVLTGFGFAIITSAAMPLFTLSIGTFFKYRRKAVKAEAAEAQPVSLP